MMLRTIKTISEFKKMSTMTHDNSKIASANWAKSWGMTYWENVWYYKEYTLRTLKCRTGQVIMRHTKYSVTCFYVGEKEITKEKFLEICGTIEYKPKQIEVKVKPISQPQATQMEFSF